MLGLRPHLKGVSMLDVIVSIVGGTLALVSFFGAGIVVYVRARREDGNR